MTTSITNFEELDSHIINTTVPTVLAFTSPNTFGKIWLLRMRQHLDLFYDLNLSFRIITNDKMDELAIMTQAGGEPVIFFIQNRKIIAKSLGRVSESNFMKNLKKIYPAIGQAA